MRLTEFTKWEEERKKFFRDREIENVIEIKYEEIEKRDREEEVIERWGKIEESRYNKWYGVVKKEGLPKYLEKGWGERKWTKVARFRLGNEVKECIYWEKEKNRKCRICESEEGTWEPVWERCVRGSEEEEGWQENVEKFWGKKV